jgi:hypothetical protein
MTDATPAADAPVTVVLVHGAFADASSWNGVIARLQARDVQVTAPANPLRGITRLRLSRERDRSHPGPGRCRRPLLRRRAVVNHRYALGGARRVLTASARPVGERRPSRS